MGEWEGVCVGWVCGECACTCMYVHEYCLCTCAYVHVGVSPLCVILFCRLRDCGENLLVDLSEVLFNELGFFRVLQDMKVYGHTLLCSWVSIA